MDKLELMQEADRRGILPPEQKALLDEATKRGLVGKPASVSVGDTIRQIPRQVGLAVREGAEGLADTAGIVTEPIRALVNPVLGAAGLPKAGSTRGLVTAAADAVGLPSPEGPNERVIGDATRLVAGGGGLVKVAQRVAGAVASPTAKTIATSMAANPGLQAASGATAGAAGGSVREAGGGPLEQFGASLAGGLSGAGLSALAVKAYTGISNAIGSMLKPKQSMTEINVVLNQILEQNGIDVSKVGGMVRNELATEVKKALDTGKQLDPDVVRRIADYGVVGATPTRGTVTLDPVQITQEKNLAKLGANSTDSRLQELARVQNTNNQAFIGKLNELGGGTENASGSVAGRKAVDAITSRDAAAKATENALYAKARDSQGRAIDLDREGFIMDAYNRLGESNKSAFLPDNIKSLLEQIRAGKAKLLDGTERPTPFNVDVIDNLKTTLATASRSAQDGNTRAAIAQVRAALENVQPRATGAPVGGNQVVDPGKLAAAQGQADTLSADSMGAFDAARRFARARRNWQESSPGIAAALEDGNPDRFVKDFILSGSNKAATAEVEKLMLSLRKDPDAAQAVKENVLGYLKSKAISGAADEVGNFSQAGYNRALSEMGEKLRLFFNADEIAQLKALGRVASYEMVQPKGSAVNNSNTAGAFTGILDRIASSPLLGKVPFGDAALRQPARNWSTQIGTANALDATGAMVKAPARSELPRLEQLAAPGLLLIAPRAHGRDDEQRR